MNTELPSQPVIKKAMTPKTSVIKISLFISRPPAQYAIYGPAATADTPLRGV
jgi:hypothetical protein